MAKSLTRQTFGVPSQGVLELIETSDRVARLSEAGSAYETKVRELEHQFEVKASDLREEYLAEVLEIHTAEEFGPRDRLKVGGATPHGRKCRATVRSRGSNVARLQGGR
jgi:hypothetical protein